MIHSGFDSGLGHYGNWFCGPGDFFPGPLGWVITLLFWGGILYLVIRLLQSLVTGHRNQGPDSLDTIRERYARGEIDQDEYRRLKAELL